jgi:DNA-directed RNA polymerase specialized sigma subunit
MAAIEEFFEFEKQASVERSAKDFELWQQWNAAGRDQESLKPLLKAFRPVINSHSNTYARSNPNLPPEAVRMDFMNHAVKAFESYDPNRGTSLHTHVNWRLLQGRRFVSTYGSGLGRIPENRVYKVQQFLNARDELTDTLGRPPAASEMADHLKWPVKHVTALELETRSEVPSSLLPADTTSIMPERGTEVLRLLQYELNPEETAVLEHLYGMNGKPKLKPGDIAKQLNMSSSKVSKIKLNIANKAKEYL